MPIPPPSSPASPIRKLHRGKLVLGWVFTLLVAAILLFSGAMKLTLIGQPNPPKEFVEGMGHLGWPIALAVPLGIVELSCVLIFLIPRTAVLGAILITGYMGGAIATHVRVGDPFVVQALVGVVAWVGVALREPRVWGVAPWRRTAKARSVTERAGPPTAQDAASGP